MQNTKNTIVEFGLTEGKALNSFFINFHFFSNIVLLPSDTGSNLLLKRSWIKMKEKLQYLGA